MIRLINGNLIDAKEDILVQQVNSSGILYSNIQKEFVNIDSNLNKYYTDFCTGDCLGHCQLIKINIKGKNKYLANLFAQEECGEDKCYTDYDLLTSALNELKDYAELRDLSIAMPYKMGCESGGSEWEIVYAILSTVFSEYTVTLYRI